MRVLITRPEPDASELAGQLASIGVDAALAPLLSIVYEPIEPAALAGASALVATSRNALQALNRSQALSAARKLPVFAVGPATSALAKQMGFPVVISGPGTASALVATIQDHTARLGEGPLVHLAGDSLAFGLAAELARSDIVLNVIPAYRSRPINALPKAVIDGLAAGHFDAVILMSPRTAQVWQRLIGQAGLAESLGQLTHVCLSAAVADKLQIRSKLKIVVAHEPNGQEIVSLIARLAAGH